MRAETDFKKLSKGVVIATFTATAETGSPAADVVAELDKG